MFGVDEIFKWFKLFSLLKVICKCFFYNLLRLISIFFKFYRKNVNDSNIFFIEFCENVVIEYFWSVCYRVLYLGIFY